MPKFVKTDRVAVSDDAGSVVYVRRKMDAGARLRVTEASHKGESLLMLYVTNILSWEGPEFKDPTTGKLYPCTAETIEKIDLDDPFWEKVGDKIAELNPNLRGEADPLGSTTDGQPSMPESNGVLEASSTTK